MEYYYPDNMAQQTLFAEYWNGKDLIVLIILFVFAILLVIAFSSFWGFMLLFLYAIFSAKIANGYSITKLGILYTRFLITDTLIYHWR